MTSFLQSSEWEEFQHSIGRKTWRIDGQLIIQHKLPFDFNYLYSPRPHIENADSFFTKAREIAQKEKAIFLKIDPNLTSSLRGSEAIEAIPIIKRLLCFARNDIKISNPLQPQKTVILDLYKPEKELLAAMREKTRYNIRLAERRGVTVRQSSDLETFWDLLQETAQRDGFRTHERQYYGKLTAIKSENFSNELFLAEYRGKVFAAALVNFYRGPASIVRASTYLHGASSRARKELMAPHLLHWRIIQEAKRRGFHSYDFWGIDEKRWPGVTRFKKGFGGSIVEYPPGIDVIFRPLWCRLYLLVKSCMSPKGLF